MIYILIYSLIINALTYAAYAADKWAARYKYWRVSERKLLTLMLLGGTPAGLYAAKKLRHKTKKKSYRAWVAVIIILQVVFVMYLVVRFVL